MIIALQIPANNDREAYQNALDDALPDNFKSDFHYSLYICKIPSH